MPGISLRSFFPYIQSSGVTYLDTAASAHKPQAMIDAITHFYTSSYATVHRGLYQDAEKATTLYEEARELCAKLLDAPSAQEIAFTKGTTESLNALAYMLRSKVNPGDHILLTEAEHHANLIPWQRLAEESGAKLVFIPVDKKTHMLVNPSDYVTAQTKIVSVTMCSNILGDIWQAGDLEKFLAAARFYKAVTIIDAAQAAPHQKISLRKLNVDALVVSGHKLYGPTGVGIMYVSKALARSIQPYQVGGGMVQHVDFTSATFAPAPTKFEAGTPAIASIIGLGASVRFILENFNFDQIAAHETKLIELACLMLSKVDGIQLVAANNQQHKHVLAFGVDGMHAHDLAGHLGERQIAVRAGHHCVQPLVTTLGHQSLLRISVGCYTSVEDIINCCNAIEEIVTSFRKHMSA